MIQNMGFGATFYIEDGFSSPLKRAKQGLFSLEDHVVRAQANFGGLFSGFAAGASLLAIGMGVLTPFKEALNVSMAFNAQMAKVGAITKATGQDFEALKVLAKEMGTTTAFTAKQAAEAMQFLGMAGFNTNQILAATPATLSLAAASGLDLAKTADIASNVMTVFGMRAEEMGRAADVLASVTTSANVNMTQLGESVKYAAGLAKTFNISFEETSAAIGLLGNAGLQGSVATQTLSTAFTRLANPTGKMALLMNELRATTDFTGFFNAQGEFIGIAGAFEQLEKATAGKTPEQIAKIQSTLFGSNAMKNIASLADAMYERVENGIKVVYRGAEAIRAYEQDLRNSEGAAAEMARKMNDTLAGDVTLMKSALEGLKLSIGDAIEPAVRKVTQAFTALVAMVASVLDTPLGRFVSLVVASFGALITVLGGAMVGFYAVKIAVAVLLPMLITLTQTMFAAIGTFLAAAAPILAVVTAIGLLIFAGYKLYQTFTEGSERAIQFALGFSLLLGPIGLVINAIAGVFAGVKRFDAVLSGAEAPAQGFIGILQRIGGILRFVQSAWESFAFDAQKGFVFNIDETLFNTLKRLGLAEFALNATTWIARIKVAILGFWEGLQKGIRIIKDVATAVWQSIEPVAVQLGDWGGLLSKNEDSLESWKRAGLIAATAILAVLGAFAAVAAVIVGVFAAIVGVIGLVGYSVYQLYQLVLRLWTNLAAGVAQLQAAGSALWGAFVGALGAGMQALSDKFEAIKGAGGIVFDFFASKVEAIAGFINRVAAAMVDPLAAGIGVLSPLFVVIGELFGRMIATIKGAFAALFEAVKSIGTAVFDFLASKFDGVLGLFDSVSALFNRFTGGSVAVAPQGVGAEAQGGSVLETISELPSVKDFVAQVIQGKVSVAPAAAQGEATVQGAGTVVVQNVLDGKLISETVIDALDTQRALRNY